MRLSTAKPGAFAGLRQLDRALDRQVPRMPQVEIGNVAREHVLVRESGAIVGCREARDRQRGIHRVAHRLRREIGGAGVPALLADVDRDADALVAVVLDGFDLAPAHRHGLADAFAHLGLGGARAALRGVIEHVPGDLPELVGAEGKMRFGHRRAWFRWDG